MYWIYILECENKVLYVGQTSRLFRRFWEHERGVGGVNTSIFKPIRVVAVYKLSTLGNFFYYNKFIYDSLSDHNYYLYFNNLKYLDRFNKYHDYNKLQIENNIAECLMIQLDNWTRVRGGMYTRFDKEYKKPINKYLENLPLCDCNLPCDIKYSKKDKFLYFRCPKKNLWNKVPMNDHSKACKFYKEYTKDIKYREVLLKKREEYRQEIRKLFKKGGRWLENIPKLNGDICVGGCQRSLYKNICYSYEDKRLCWDCFKNNSDTLEKEYDIFKTYMIDDSYE